MIANPGGQMVVGQFGSFIHGLMKNYTKPIEDGDIILLSDPYSCEGAMSHANDWLVVQPIFHGGSRLVGGLMPLILQRLLRQTDNTDVLSSKCTHRLAGRPCSAT
jgi:hypothetical protein